MQAKPRATSADMALVAYEWLAPSRAIHQWPLPVCMGSFLPGATLST